MCMFFTSPYSRLVITVPTDPEGTSTAAELLLESYSQDLEIWQWECHLEVAAPEVHTYRLLDTVRAEAALALELPA